MVSCGRAVWSRIHCFSFGVTRISDRNDFKEGRVTWPVMLEDCTWWSCPVHRARGENRFQRPVTVDILPQSRPYLRKFPQPPNPALPAGNKLVTGISDSKQSILVTSALKTHDKISLCNPGWSGPYCVVHGGLKFLDNSSRVQRLYATTPSL